MPDESADTGEMVVEVTLDPTKCMASGNCSFWAPKTFELPDNNAYSVVLKPLGDPIEKILAAARGCPTQSIQVKVDGDRLH